MCVVFTAYSAVILAHEALHGLGPDDPRAPDRPVGRPRPDAARVVDGTDRQVQPARVPVSDTAEARHGPYFSLTRAVAGKTQTRSIPAGEVETVHRQIEAGRQFRDATELSWAACERLADAELARGDDTAAAAAEKGGSGRRSRRRLRENSKRS